MPTPFISTEPFRVLVLLFLSFSCIRRTLCGQRDAGNDSCVQPRHLCPSFSFFSITRISQERDSGNASGVHAL